MKVKINCQRQKNKRLDYLLTLLPEDISHYLYEFSKENSSIQIDEIRLHANSYMHLISSFSNIKTSLYITEGHISESLFSFCNGSIYSQFNTIKEGYLSIGQGIRVGICGKATIQNGDITGITDFSSLNIRMPKRIYGAANYLYSIMEKDSFRSSILLYSSPGVGKTTILRELICKLSEGDSVKRVSVIDSREELKSGIEQETCADFFLSYPKESAITFATRTMTPEIIICDEITTLQEAYAILNSSNCGVTFVATTHASSFDELKCKEILLPLFERNVFKYALGISRRCGSKKYEYELNSLVKCCV